MSNLLPLLLADTLTGSAFYLCWLLLQERLDKPGYMAMLCRLQHLAVWLFLLPVTALLHMILVVVGREGSTKGILLFELTGSMRAAAEVIGEIWLLGLCLYAAVFFCQYAAWHRIKRRAVPAEPELRKIGRECRENLKVEKEIPVYVIDGISTSYVGGAGRPAIWLPAGKSEEEYRILLYHEYMHIRRRDTGRNALVEAVCALHWWNPLVWDLKKRVKIWEEFGNDHELMELGLVNMKDYCMLLYRQAGEGGTDFFGGGVSGFSKKESLVRERIERMIRQKQDNKKAGFRMYAATAAALIAALAVSMGGTVMVAKAQERWYLDTMEFEEIEMAPEWEQDTELEVYEESDFAGYTVVDAEETGDGIMPLTTKQFTCYVDPTSLYRSAGFYVEKGTVIEILCGFTPEDVTVKVGVYTPDHTYKLKDVTRSGYIRYTAETSGTYKIAVVNGNSQEVTGNGSYTY